MRDARLAQAAHHEAAIAIRDAQTLRLQVLLDELMPIVQARRESADFIQLALVPGDQPRLWIDLTSYIVMAPDPRTYRLVQDTRDGANVLFETKQREEMRKKATEFIAHRSIARQRELPARLHHAPLATGRYSRAALILAWLTGFSFGVLALFVLGALFYPLP